MPPSRQALKEALPLFRLKSAAVYDDFHAFQNCLLTKEGSSLLGQGTLPILDMAFILASKEPQAAQDRICGSLADSANRARSHGLAKLLEESPGPWAILLVRRQNGEYPTSERSLPCRRRICRRTGSQGRPCAFRAPQQRSAPCRRALVADPRGPAGSTTDSKGTSSS